MKVIHGVAALVLAVVACSDRDVSSGLSEGGGMGATSMAGDTSSPEPGGAGISCGEDDCALGQACVSCPIESEGWEFECVGTDENGNPADSDCRANAVVALCDGPEDCGALEVCTVFYAANSTIAKCLAAPEGEGDCLSPGPRACHGDEDCLCGACERMEGPQLLSCNSG